MTTRVRVPGKVILTGEHAVIYGAPALALAIDRYAFAEVTTSTCVGLHLSLPDLDCQRSFSFSSLMELTEAVTTRYKAWQSKQEANLIDVLEQPEQLHLWAIGKWLSSQSLDHTRLSVRVEITSQLCGGMGSSSATVAAAVLALSHHLNQPLSVSELMCLVTQSEHLQHGFSSGLDPTVCILGGMIHYIQGRTVILHGFFYDQRWLLIDTGRPKCGTGVCIEAVAQLGLSKLSWKPWHDLAAAWKEILSKKVQSSHVELLRYNHRLLLSLGVVPNRVADFVDQLELYGAGAKICGAGAICGESAGLVLVCASTSQVDSLFQLSASWGYKCWPLNLEAEGARII